MCLLSKLSWMAESLRSISVFLIHAFLLLDWLGEKAIMSDSLLFVNLTLDNQKLDDIS